MRLRRRSWAAHRTLGRDESKSLHVRVRVTQRQRAARCILAVKHGGAETDNKNSEVRKAYAIVIGLTEADNHAIKCNRRNR